MKRVTGLRLGATVALAIAVNAQAADLPSGKGAPAAEYVKVCKDGAFAGFAIPGSDACLKVSGLVDAQFAMGRLAGKNWASAGGAPTAAKYADEIGLSTRGQINFDALTDTAMGPALAHVELRARAGDNRFDWSSGPALYAAYVQWAGFTAGRHSSFYWPSP